MILEFGIAVWVKAEVGAYYERAVRGEPPGRREAADATEAPLPSRACGLRARPEPEETGA
jgi:hypothetical protein